MGVPPRVIEAERLFRQGNFDAAAAAFEQLAGEAEQRGMPGAAGEMHLQAGRCYLQKNDVAKATEHGKRALALFVEAGQFPKARRLMPQLIAALENKGHKAEAEALRREVEQALAGKLPGARAVLPAKCPQCSAPIKPDEVKWLSALSAECPYCGAVLKPERS
jgi:tetratricopeptide (TPR) repeat protein